MAHEVFHHRQKCRSHHQSFKQAASTKHIRFRWVSHVKLQSTRHLDLHVIDKNKAQVLWEHLIHCMFLAEFPQVNAHELNLIKTVMHSSHVPEVTGV